MSLPSIHSPTTFAAVLDPERGGRFALAPAGEYEAARRYLGRTNVLETTYRTGDGVVRVTEALTLQDGGLLPWVELARRIEGMEGSVRLEWRLEPRFDWGREPPSIVRRGDHLVAEGAGLQLSVHSWEAGEVEPEEDALAGSFEIAAGEKAMLALVAAHEQPLHLPSRDHVEARLDATSRVWERWLGMWAYDGPWEEEVARSALALKLLVYASDGSIAAAPTTSLPEVVGGDKNYDYRYAWVRDSAYTLDALMRLGLPEQVQQSFAWLLRAVRETAPDLRPFYDLGGGVPTRRETLDHLRGYRDSRPVRVRERGLRPAPARLVGRPARDRGSVRLGGQCARRGHGRDVGRLRRPRRRPLAGQGLRHVGTRRAPPPHRLEDRGLDGVRPRAAPRRGRAPAR